MLFCTRTYHPMGSGISERMREAINQVRSFDRRNSRPTQIVPTINTAIGDSIFHGKHTSFFILGALVLIVNFVCSA